MQIHGLVYKIVRNWTSTFSNTAAQREHPCQPGQLTNLESRADKPQRDKPANLVNLEELFLHRARTLNTSALTNLANLQKLDCGETNVCNVNFLVNFLQLKTLGLGDINVNKRKYKRPNKALAQCFMGCGKERQMCVFLLRTLPHNTRHFRKP